MTTTTTCQHTTYTAAPAAGETIASVWECEDCGHTRPFTAEDFAFCNITRWAYPPSRFSRSAAR